MAGNSKKPIAQAADGALHHLAFDNSLQANIITTVSTGRIIVANSAACKLLGYSKKELLTKNRSAIFDINEGSFKRMLKQRTDEGRSVASLTAIKKTGKSFPCEITSAVFLDSDGIKKAITTILDMSQRILRQKKADARKEKIVADDILLAQSNQRDIDTRKEKIVAENIVLAISKQIKIDTKKEKIVAENIVIAISKQKEIDTIKEKIVSDNIVMAVSNQKKIDTKKEKIVADDIALAIRNQKGIDAAKEKIVAENIVLAISKQKEIDIIKEKIVSDNIVLAKSKQKKIDTEREKIVAGNILLAQEKSDARLAENTEWIKYITKASYDVMWDWDIPTGEIYVGDSIEEVFGYRVENNTINFTDFWHCLLPEEKDAVKMRLLNVLASGSKGWNDAYLFKRHDGTIASTTSRASIVRNEEGKAIRLIGAIQDVSRLQDLEKKLDDQIAVKWEHSIISSLAAKLSFDGIWDWNILTNEFFLGEGFQELFGYAFSSTGDIAFDWRNYLHPDDREAVEKGLKDAIASSANRWEQACRFIRADGFVAEVFSRASILRHADGSAYRMIGAMHDISRQKVLEERLEQEIKLKEIQIAQATENAKDTERSDIGKELHDNVNQLLGASRLYLDMAKKGDGDSEMYLSRTSEYILTAIEEIRKLTKGMTTDVIKNIGLCDAIRNVTRDAMEVNPVKISCTLESFIERSVHDKFKLNVFRIVQEHLNNILKHSKATKVALSLLQNKKSITLSISDNGVGFDTAKTKNGIGLANIKSRASSYNGTADFVSEAGHGCGLTVTFPVTEALVA